MISKIKLTEPLDAAERTQLELVTQAVDEQRLECISIAESSPADHELFGTAEKLNNAWIVLHGILVADKAMVGNSDNVVNFARAE